MISDDGWTTSVGLLAVIALVLANGFFVASEFALVAVRRSRVAELVNERRRNAKALLWASDHLDAHLAATQLGITIASLALGWIGEPALAHLIEPALAWLPSPFPAAAAHTAAVIVSFVIITALHIVLGELAPKSLALQRSEHTALAVIRPLSLFVLVFRPAIWALNGLGNGVLRLFGLEPGQGEGAHHSTAELSLLVQESREAGLIHETQQEAVERVFSLGERRVREIMTPRHQIEWINSEDNPERIREAVRGSSRGQLVLSQGSVDEVVGIARIQDLLDQLLDGGAIDVSLAARPPIVVHEAMSVLAVLETFRRKPVQMAIVVDEYGSLTGIITTTDLLEAIAGNIPEPGEEPGFVEREDGSLLIDGMTPAVEAFARLSITAELRSEDFDTLAGYVISRLGRIPVTGDSVQADGWRFEVMDMDGRRVDKVLAAPSRMPQATNSDR